MLREILLDRLLKPKREKKRLLCDFLIGMNRKGVESTTGVQH